MFMFWFGVFLFFFSFIFILLLLIEECSSGTAETLYEFLSDFSHNFSHENCCCGTETTVDI